MSDSSSSDGSDIGERVKNIKSLLVKSRDTQRESDENYAYKQKLGDLIFDANFEGGNLGLVEQIDEHAYDLMVRPDVANPRHRIWFNFAVSNQRPNQCVIFTFVNLSENITLFNDGLTPVARSRERPNWMRLHQDQVFYYRSASHKDRLVLSIAFKFDTHNNEHQFALFYPYTLSRLDGFINRWQVELKRRQINGLKSHCSNTTPLARLIQSSINLGNSESTSPSAGKRNEHLSNSSYSSSKVPSLANNVNFGVDIITRSVLSKPIYMLSISSGLLNHDKSPVFILLKQWNGNFDNPISLVCQGYLDFILSDDPLARVAREHFKSIVFPMIDPDSIWAGNGRSDIFGQSYSSSNILESNPSLYQNFKSVSQQIKNLVCSDENRHIIIVDVHVNPNIIGSRMIGTNYDKIHRMERHLRLPRLLSRFADGFYMEKCEFNLELKFAESILDFKRYKNVDQYRLEVSPYGYYRRSLKDSTLEVYDQEKYLLMGKSIAYSVLDMSRPILGNTIPKNVARLLDSFHKDFNDIDDLMLLNSEV